MQQRLPDGGRDRTGKTLWKNSPNEKKGLFYNIRLHRLARRNLVPFDPVILRSGEDGVGGELGPMVGDNHAGHAALGDQFRQFARDTPAGDRGVRDRRQAVAAASKKYGTASGIGP